MEELAEAHRVRHHRYDVAITMHGGKGWQQSSQAGRIRLHFRGNERVSDCSVGCPDDRREAERCRACRADSPLHDSLTAADSLGWMPKIIHREGTGAREKSE